MDFLQKYDNYKAQFEQALDDMIKDISAYSVQGDKLLSAAVYSLKAGGKRIRPVLTLASAETMGGSADSAMPFALALECIHTYSLIHDDLPCMDNDDLRRGKPTNHKVYGEAIAVLAGDALLNLSYQIMLKHISQHPSKYNILAASVIAECAGMHGMIGGQAMDISCESGESQPSLKNLEYIHLNKTGALLRAACASGGYSAEAEEGHITTLSRYGAEFGLLFQITDDILDETGSAKALGKSVGKDKASGKLTYVTLTGIEKSRDTAKKHLSLAIESAADMPGGGSFLQQLALYVSGREF